MVECSPHNPKVEGLSPDTAAAKGKNGKELIITPLIIPAVEKISPQMSNVFHIGNLLDFHGLILADWF